MPHLLTATAPASMPTETAASATSPARTPWRRTPTYRPAINLPGRRFRVEGTKIWTLFLQGSMMF